MQLQHYSRFCSLSWWEPRSFFRLPLTLFVYILYNCCTPSFLLGILYKYFFPYQKTVFVFGYQAIGILSILPNQVVYLWKCVVRKNMFGIISKISTAYSLGLLQFACKGIGKFFIFRRWLMTFIFGY